MAAARLILASSSPRRRELLAADGYAFDVVPPHVDEISDTPLTLTELTLLNAARKARDVAATNRSAVVIGADTLVSFDGEVLGKPANLAHAREMLRRLSGRTHEVATSFAVIHRARMVAHSEISRVQFKPLDRATIDEYFRRIDPLDKAGAYAAQGEGQMIIAKIDGSFSNVVGLPMEALREVLAQFSVTPSRPARVR